MLITASDRSRPPGPPAVPGVFYTQIACTVHFVFGQFKNKSTISESKLQTARFYI